ncbi:hypothetical protein AcW1_006681 [Taiwanofungus camphoratus]|nr:hypothetical protein AcV5_009268 [Antrodia cinnamomea]KAI0924600.1 hypothetical protein AcW2_005443 [Antrodia cinnamomea]KAI0954044.1 hypothetical protein AcV7_007390 [Antrodia cinnamomea]KAI0954941.1 hypothetical protein AcW1_006681 [Antrodia cinnamomea]
MAKVSLVSANLAALCVGSVLYGIFFVLAVLSIYLLVLRRREIAAKSPVASAPRPIYLTPIIVAAIAISITITGHWIVTVVRLFDAFVNFDGGARPAAFYGEQSQPTQVVKTVSISITFLIADVMLIYRLWIVWGYNYLVIIFPACTVLGLVAAAVGTAHSFATCPPDTTIFTSSFKAWLTTEYVFTFTTNVYCSLFIAWRVWRAHIESREYGATSLMGLIAIIVESAALYT